MSSNPETTWRRLAIGSFVTLVAVVVTWNVVAYAIDASALEGSADGWGVLFGSAIATVIYGGLPLVLSFVAAVVAAVGSPATARVCAWCVAALCAVCAIGLVAISVLTVTATAAERVFGVSSLLLALVLLAPVVLCVRRARSGQRGIAGAVPAA